MAIILGIDPGSRITGYGVVDLVKHRFRYLGSGCIRMQSQELPQKLQTIYLGLKEIITEFQPAYCAIEQVFMAKNPDSALKLGHARGVAILAVIESGRSIAEYSARQVKQAVVGTGAADKSQVQHMVKHLLQLDKSPQADAADALAIAMCHGHSLQGLVNFSNQAITKTARGRLQ